MRSSYDEFGSLTGISPFWKRLEMSIKDSEGLLGVKKLKAKYHNTAMRTIPAMVCPKSPSAASPPPALMVMASAAVVVVVAAAVYGSATDIYLRSSNLSTSVRG